jgi:hypothetical protein
LFCRLAPALVVFVGVVTFVALVVAALVVIIGCGCAE